MCVYTDLVSYMAIFSTPMDPKSCVYCAAIAWRSALSCARRCVRVSSPAATARSSFLRFLF